MAVADAEGEKGMSGKVFAGSSMVAGAAVLWGLMGTFAKHLFVHEGVSPLALAVIRAVLAFAILLFLTAAWDRRLFQIRLRNLPLLLLLGVGGLAAGNFAYYLTISLTTVATAILLQYMAPILVALFSVVLFRERLTGVVLTALALAVGGCFLMVRGYDLEALTFNLPGLLSGLSAACAFAFYILFSKRALERMKPWTFLLYAYAAATLFWWFLLPPWAILKQGYPPRLWGFFLVVALFGTLLPFGLFAKGLTFLPATHVGILSTLEPVVAAVASALFLGERLVLPQVVGGLLVIAGVLLVQQKRKWEAIDPS